MLDCVVLGYGVLVKITLSEVNLKLVSSPIVFVAAGENVLLFYSDFKSKVKQKHIFSCSFENNRDGNQL